MCSVAQVAMFENRKEILGFPQIHCAHPLVSGARPGVTDIRKTYI
jgi:hypothetical protein